MPHASFGARGAAPAQVPADTVTIWDGVYTPAQASRGQRTYERACGSCHGVDLKGSMDAPPLIGSAALKAHLLETWAAVCGDQPAPLPEVVLPTGDELYFRSGDRGVVQEFRFTQPPAGEVTLAIVDGRKRPVSTCVLRPPPQPSLVDWGGGRSEPLAFDGSHFALPLPAGFYRYTAAGALDKSSLFAVEGVDHVEL